MRDAFELFLIKHKYRLTTPRGYKSTIYDYIKRIDNVCNWERCSWENLATNIVTIVPIYDVGGAKEELGNKSHRSVINALKRFKEFVQSEYKIIHPIIPSTPPHPASDPDASDPDASDPFRTFDLKLGDVVYHKKWGYGRIVKITPQEKHEKQIEVKFGESVVSFNFPRSFLDGHLIFEDDKK